MKDSAGKGRGFWSEIRRRGIVHVTGLYLVAAWLIVQVADTLAQGPLPMPVEALQHIWLALGLIFPIALIFGWRYDITREGIVRTVPHTGGREDRPLRPIDHSIIAGLSLVIAGVLGLTSMEIMEAIEHDRLRAGVGVEEAVGPAPVNSIAVLPFAVCSDQQGDQILAAGLAAEVIDRLASLGTFKVIARASSFTIAGFGLSLRQIAQPLRVKYLLTGELCRDGDRLLLRVELSDDEGYVVWSEVYEQTSDRWDRITVTLAAQVTQGVSGALGHGFTGEPNAPVNRLAYEQLVIGKEYAEQDQFDRARAAFEEALEHEPDYAEAVWELAQLVEWEALSSGDLTLDYLGEAWPLGERALDMARRRVADGRADFQTYGVLGWMLFKIGKWEERLARSQAGELSVSELTARLDASSARIEEAEGYVRTALALNASHIDHYVLLGYIVERQGVHRRNEALEIFEQAYSADPFNPLVNRQVAKRWAARGQYRQAMELLERFEVLPKVPPAVRFVQLEIRKLQTYWDEKCELLLEMLRDEPEAFEHDGNYGHLVWFPSELAQLGMLEAAEAWYQRVEKIPADGWAAVLREWFVDDYQFRINGNGEDDVKARVAELDAMSDEDVLSSELDWTFLLAEAGEYDRAIRLAESQQQMRLDSTFWIERKPWPRLFLAGLYQAAGRDSDADALLQDIVGDLEAEYAIGIRHPQTLEFLATAYAMQGRDDDALDMYRKAVDYHLRRQDLPDWPPPKSPWTRLRDDPRFAMQWDRMQADLVQQGARIRAMLARYDIDELLGPTVALAENRAAKSDDGN